MFEYLLLCAVCGITAVRTESPPAIDGVLDEHCWTLTEEVSQRFNAFRPRVDCPLSEPTDIRVLFDNNSVYFGLHMHDADPGGIQRPVGSRDVDLATDRVIVYLDTFNDDSNCFMFSVSVGGTQVDSRRTEIGGEDRDWDGVWSSAVAVNDSGWSAEIAIPFSVLRYPADEVQVWGINFGRTINRSNEGAYLFRMREQGGMDISCFGELTGLYGLPGVSGTEWRPFCAGRLKINNGEPWRENLWGSAGFDLKVPVSMHAVMDLTVNPDFGQVESDADQGSISHWAPWLSERRPFFMEGTDIFDMPFDMFYSRSIGSVAWNGEIIPILGGAKITGVNGGNRYGFLEVVTGKVMDDTTLVEPAGSYALGAFLHEFSPGNWLRFSGTSADFPSQEGGDYLYGRSGAFTGEVEALPDIFLKGRLGLTWNRFNDNEDNSAARLEAGFFPENFELNLRFERKGEGFDPGIMGYGQAAGETLWSVYTSASTTFRGGFLQSAWLGANPYTGRDADGRNCGSGVDVWTGAVTVDRYDLNISGGWTDRWFDRYEGPEGVWYPGGFYGGVSASTDYRRQVAGWAAYNRDTYLDAHTDRYSAGLFLRPVPPLSIDIEPAWRTQEAATRYNWDTGEWDLVETDWRSLNISATWMLTNRMLLRLTGQTSRFERIWETGEAPETSRRTWANVLFSWEYLPGSFFHFLSGEDGVPGEEPGFTVYAKVSRFF